MSKYVKQLVTDHIRQRLEGVSDLVLVNVIGMDSASTTNLRRKLREKNLNLLVVKNSTARRATEGTSLAAAFEGSAGTLAMIWGGEDIVSLAKEVTKLVADPLFPKLSARGGVMDGAALTPEGVGQVSKWKSRTEQLSLISAQILAPGANLSAALLGPGKKLNSQVKKLGEGSDDSAAAAADDPAAPAADDSASPAAAADTPAPAAE